MSLSLRRSSGVHGDLRAAAVCIGLVVLSIICQLDYDAQAGLTYRHYPLNRQIQRITKEQACSLIGEHKIKSYGVRRGEIIMLSKTGIWFSLDYYRNEEVIRQVAQEASYTPYYDRYRDSW